MITTGAERRAAKRKYDRLYASTRTVKTAIVHIVVPENVERVEVSEPCFPCGIARGPCKHRPWVKA